MRRVSLLFGPLLIVLVACDVRSELSGPSDVVSEDGWDTSVAVAEPPTFAEPTRAEPCPYLDATFVEQTNGQRVAEMMISTDDPPVCEFLRPDGNVQLTVRVYTGDPAVAKAFVDTAAPIDTSNPADLSGGWSGGAQPTDDGAVYAVAKDATAVVVTTNQAQTIKAKLVARETIDALGL